MNKSGFSKTILAFQIFAVIFGGLSLLGGVVGIYKGFQLLSGGRIVEGTAQKVLYLGHSSGRNLLASCNYDVDTVYKDSAGTDLLYARGCVHSFATLNIGDEVDVMYYEQDPRLSVVWDPTPYWSGRFLYLMLGGFLLAAAYIISKKKKENPNFQEEFKQGLTDLMQKIEEDDSVSSVKRKVK